MTNGGRSTMLVTLEKMAIKISSTCTSKSFSYFGGT